MEEILLCFDKFNITIYWLKRYTVSAKYLKDHLNIFKDTCTDLLHCIIHVLMILLVAQ